MINYSANTAISFDLSALPGSVNGLAGRESTQVDNTTTRYDGALVNVKGIIGHAATAPVIGQRMSLYVWGADTSLATTGIDALDGTDSAETLTHGAILNSLRHVATTDVTVATAALTYFFQPFDVAAFFNGVMPKFWGLYATHNQAGALGAANSALFSFNGITYTAT